MDKKAVRLAAERYQEYVLSPYDVMIGTDGFEAVCTFVDTFSGSNVYIPQMRTIFGPCLERYIVDEWNGANMRELVRKCGFSERHVRNLIRRAV